MVQFLSIIFFSWISSIFVGFFKSSRFFVSPSIYSPFVKGANKLLSTEISNHSNITTVQLYKAAGRTVALCVCVCFECVRVAVRKTSMTPHALLC